MNATIAALAREEIIHRLIELPSQWQNTFKLMYGRNGGRRSVEDAEAMPIEEVVAEMPDEKLDWALTQVELSIKKYQQKGQPQ